MGFKKSFRKETDKSVYPKWVEVELTAEEEKEAARKARTQNIKMMLQCVDDAEIIAKDKGLLQDDAAITQIARSLFDKRASHEVFHKERSAKEKFDKLHGD